MASGEWRPSGKVSVWTFVLWPFAAAVAGAIGVAQQFAVHYNPYGIGNFLLVIIAAFAVGFIGVQWGRLGKNRHRGIGSLGGILIGAAYLAAGFIAAPYIDNWQSPKPVTQWWIDHKATGLKLFGSSGFALKGWLLATVWIIEAVLFILTGWATGLVEAGRPFCEKCNSWARKSKWTFRIARPDPGPLAALKKQRTLDAAIAMTGGDGEERTALRYVIGACTCGSIATLGTGIEKTDKDGNTNFNTFLDDMQLSRRMLTRLMDWAESRDPSMSSKRLHLSLADLASSQGGPLPDLLPIPTEEERAMFRWSGSNGAADAWADNAYTRVLRERLTRGDWKIIPQALAAQTSADDYGFIAEACGDWNQPPDWLEDWEDHEPDSGVRYLISGIAKAKWAWEARGGNWVPKNFPLFQDRLALAEADLMEAAERLPNDATPCAWLITCSIGLQHPVEIAADHLKQAHKRSPFHRTAHSTMVKKLTSKWGESDEKMLEFARRVSGIAPAGHYVHLIVAQAYYEAAGTMVRDKQVRAMEDFLSQPKPVADLRAASEKCFRVGAFKPNMTTPLLRSTFAYTLWKAGQFDLAREHLEHLGSNSPYDAFGPSIFFWGETVGKARRQCRRSSARSLSGT